MKTKHTILIASALLLGFTSGLKAANTNWTWNGSVSNSWNSKDNWTTSDNDGALNSADTVIIPAGLTTYPRIDNNAGNPTIAKLVLRGGQIALNGKSLTISGSTFFLGGTLENGGGGSADVLMNSLVVNFSGIISVPSGVHMVIRTGTIQFINGIINNGYKIEIWDNVTVSGASHLSHMMGAVSKIGDDAFTFPVGDEYYYAPFTISAPDNTGHHYTVQYYSSQFSDVSTDNTLNHISQVEYWSMEAINGASAVDVGLTWLNPRSGETDDYTNLTLSVFNGSDWTAISGTSSGTYKTGVVTGNVSNFNTTYYTIGSVSTLNPLPVKLFEFNAVKADASVTIVWKTAFEVNSAYFEVEKSVNGSDWMSIGSVKANGNSEAISQYNFSDLAPVTGVQYYRLKQFDANGQFEYSAIVQASFGPSNTINIYPQPASTTLNVHMQDGAGIEQVTIYNSLGQMVYEFRSIASDTCSIDLTGLSSGIYTIKVLCEGQVTSRRILKQ